MLVYGWVVVCRRYNAGAFAAKVGRRRAARLATKFEPPKVGRQRAAKLATKI